MQAGLKMSKTGKYVHLYASFSSVNIYNTKEVLCALNLNSSECSHVGSFSLYQWRAEKGGLGIYFMLFMLLRVQPWWCTHSLPMKSRERWFGDIYLMLFMLLREEPCWFNLYQWRAEKGGFVMYLILLPCMLAMFMTSLTQTAGHKMAVLMVMFSQPLNIDFEVHAMRLEVKWTAAVCIFSSILTDRAHNVSLVQFPFNICGLIYQSDVLNLLYV